MILTPQEESLIGLIRALPPGEAGKVFRWASQLKELAGAGPVQWSDSWTDEDLEDATRAALERFERSEQQTR